MSIWGLHERGLAPGGREVGHFDEEGGRHGAGLVGVVRGREFNLAAETAAGVGGHGPVHKGGAVVGEFIVGDGLAGRAGVGCGYETLSADAVGGITDVAA